MTRWQDEANAHWDRIRERIRANPTIIKPQRLAHEEAEDLRRQLQAAHAEINRLRKGTA
jgi:hypothetical protein